jgi:hypothetical protein
LRPRRGESIYARSGANRSQLTRANFRKRPQNARHQGKQCLVPIAGCSKDDDRDRQGGQVLLELQVSVDGQEASECWRRCCQQLAVSQTGKTGFSGRLNRVPG